jgi:hypothetical protein
MGKVGRVTQYASLKGWVLMENIDTLTLNIITGNSGRQKFFDAV